MKRREGDKEAYRWLWGLIKGKRLRLLVVILSRVVLSVMLALLALCSKQLIDAATNKQWDELMRYGAFLLALTLGRMIISTASGVLSGMTTEKLALSVQQGLVARVLGVDERAAAGYHSGVLMERVTTDAGTACDKAFSIPIAAVASLSDLASGAVTLMLLDARLLALIVVAGILMFMGSRLMRPAIQKRYEALRKSAETARAAYQETLENRVVIKAFSGQIPVAKWLRDLNDRYFSAWKRYVYMRLITSTALGSFYSMGYFLVLLLCTYRLYIGVLTFGSMTAILQLLSQLMSPFANLAGLLPILYETLTSAKRVMELEALPQEEMGNAVVPIECHLKSIRAKGLDFAYKERQVLTNVSFDIPQGSFCLISGESGVGKSTLVKLLLGLYPSNELYLETTAGEIPVGCDTRGMFAYVPQGNLLLSGTLRDNLTFFTGPRSDDELYEALKLSHADDFVRDHLKDGLDTQIGEKALGLSEGQAQRLAIARALLSDAPILLLDEATSALDPEIEAQLLTNLRAMSGKTIILVSHKPAAHAVCDMELRFENGRSTQLYRKGVADR